MGILELRKIMTKSCLIIGELGDYNVQQFNKKCISCNNIPALEFTDINIEIGKFYDLLLRENFFHPMWDINWNIKECIQLQ